MLERLLQRLGVRNLRTGDADVIGTRFGVQKKPAETKILPKKGLILPQETGGAQRRKPAN